MTQKHLFIMDPVKKLNFKLDSSLQMAHELVKLGHSCYFTLNTDLFWGSKNSYPFAHAAIMNFPEGKIAHFKLEPTHAVSLNDMNAIHMRKEPPFDMAYVATTWILDAVAKHVKIFNHPQGLREFNEKLGILQYPKYIDKFLISAKAEELLEFIMHECNGDGIVKPIDLYGGKGIFRVNMENTPHSSALAQLQEACLDGRDWRIVQPFNRNIFKGEVRAFTIGGKVINWCLKKPKEGSFFANTGSGATILDYSPSKELARTVEHVAQNLLESGIVITAFDIIGDKMSEINITSPRLLKAESDQTNYYQLIAEWYEKECK